MDRWRDTQVKPGNIVIIKCILHLLQVYYELTRWPAPSWRDSELVKPIALVSWSRVGFEFHQGLFLQLPKLRTYLRLSLISIRQSWFLNVFQTQIDEMALQQSSSLNSTMLSLDGTPVNLNTLSCHCRRRKHSITRATFTDTHTDSHLWCCHFVFLNHPRRCRSS